VIINALGRIVLVNAQTEQLFGYRRDDLIGKPIELLLTDVVRPRMSGRVLAEAVAVERPETKILFMSGYTDDAIILHRVLEPKMHFLEKPFGAGPQGAQGARCALASPATR